MTALAATAAPWQPDRFLGAVVAQATAYPTERIAAEALARLAVGPEDRVLELGCASGRLLSRLAASVRRGFVAGVDPSEAMVRHARHRNRRWLERGRLAVHVGSSADLGTFPDAHFDAVLGVHVVCFWSEPQRDLAEVWRVLRPGGRVLLGFRPDPGGARRDPGSVPARSVAAWLRAAGFGGIGCALQGEPGRPLAWVQARR
jgi:SAM-dependent methyltransferase